MNGWGGHRPGSGRKKGKLSLQTIIGEYLSSTDGSFLPDLSDLDKYLKNAELTGRMVKRKPSVGKNQKYQN